MNSYRCAWGDRIMIPFRTAGGTVFPLVFHLPADFRFRFFGTVALRRSTEPSRPLLVHLCPRRDAVDGNEEELARLHEIDQTVEMCDHPFPHLVFVAWQR